MPNKRIVPREANRTNLIIVPNKSIGWQISQIVCKVLEAQSEPVPAACINKQHSSGSPSRSLPSDKLYYRYQLLLTTKLGELVAFLRNCLASIHVQTHTLNEKKKKKKKNV